MPVSLKNVLDEAENLLTLFTKSQPFETISFLKSVGKKQTITIQICIAVYLSRPIQSCHPSLNSYNLVLKKFPLEICDINNFWYNIINGSTFARNIQRIDIKNKKMKI